MKVEKGCKRNFFKYFLRITSEPNLLTTAYIEILIYLLNLPANSLIFLVSPITIRKSPFFITSFA